MNIPLLGFGTYKLQGEQVREPLREAIRVGYRHIDTADYYQNHPVIGEVVRRSGIPRHELWLTSKLWWEDLAPDRVVRAAERFLHELQTDYLDLLLIHWPNQAIPLDQTLAAMERLQREGKVRYLGVSNFTERHITAALQTGVKIITNQVECHPSFNQAQLHIFCAGHKISLTAFMPIARGADLTHPTIVAIAQKYGRPPSQVILNWLRNRGIIAIPKASSRAHLEENWLAQKWTLEASDVDMINQIEQQPRLVNPDFAEFED